MGILKNVEVGESGNKEVTLFDYNGFVAGSKFVHGCEGFPDIMSIAFMNEEKGDFISEEKVDLIFHFETPKDIQDLIDYLTKVKKDFTEELQAKGN